MNIYQQNIIDHYKNPQNFGKLENATMVFTRQNLSCGDEITVYLIVDKGFITNIKFEGVGCAISVASSSIMTNYFIGKKFEDIQHFDFEAFRKEYLGIEINPSRMNCALIFIDALKSKI